jgi:hypothetical protein
LRGGEPFRTPGCPSRGTARLQIFGSFQKSLLLGPDSSIFNETGQNACLCQPRKARLCRTKCPVSCC